MREGAASASSGTALTPAFRYQLLAWHIEETHELDEGTVDPNFLAEAYQLPGVCGDTRWNTIEEVLAYIASEKILGFPTRNPWKRKNKRGVEVMLEGPQTGRQMIIKVCRLVFLSGDQRWWVEGLESQKYAQSSLPAITLLAARLQDPMMVRAGTPS